MLYNMRTQGEESEVQPDKPKSTAQLALLVCAFEESFVENSAPGFIFPEG